MLLAHALHHALHPSSTLLPPSSSLPLKSCSRSSCAPTTILVSNPHSVEAIFARAERVFECRVEQLLHAKREKAVTTGNAFNARKAKRDARTVAGREKLDSLVRRLADLATAQRMVLCKCGRKVVATGLDGLAAAVLGIVALHVAVESSQPQSRAVDLMDSSSCSDDGVVLAGARELATPIPSHSKIHKTKTDELPPKETFPDGRMFLATQSVVDFVLDCDDEKCVGDSDLTFDNEEITTVDDVDEVTQPSSLKASYSCERFGKRRLNTAGLAARPSHGSCASLSSLSSVSSLYPGSYGSLTSLASSVPSTGMSAISGLGFKRSTATQELPVLHRRSFDGHRPTTHHDASRHQIRQHNSQRYRHGTRVPRGHRFGMTPDADVHERVENLRTRHGVVRQPSDKHYGLVDGVMRNATPGRGENMENWVRYAPARSADDVWHGSSRSGREMPIVGQPATEALQTDINEGRWCGY